MAEGSILNLDLRLGHVRRAQQQAQPRLSRNLRQLGAVGPYVPTPLPDSRSAIVKGWFGKTSTTGAHLDYLQKDKGLGGKDAELFGRQNQTTHIARFLREAQHDTHQFRWGLSLKAVPRSFDFQRYVQRFMHQVERDLGRPLDWIAAVHHDRPHPHAHIVLRGRDRDGADLYITKDYLSRGLRYRASAIATALLGPEKNVEREQSHEPDRTPQHITGPSAEPNPTERRPKRCTNHAWERM